MILLLTILIFGLWLLKFMISRRKLYKLASLIAKPKDEMPIIGVAHKFTGNMENLMDTLLNLIYESMEHNGIIRMWLGPILFFVLTNPVDVQFVLKTCLEKDDIHRFMRTVLGNGIIFAPVNIWRTRRKFMVPAFSTKNVESTIEILSKESEALANVLEEKANGKAFKIWPYVTSNTFNSVCLSATGINPYSLNKEYSTIVEVICRSFELVSERIFHLWLQPNWLYKLFPQYQEHRKCLDTVIKYVDTIVEKVRTRENTSRSKSKISEDSTSFHNRRHFFDAIIIASGGENGYSNVELREELTSLIAAATDTSAIAIGNVLKLLAKYEEVQEKLYEELYEVFGDSNRLLVAEDLSKLEYMTRVIKETLRLFPPAPNIVRKILKDITLPSGRVLPAGSGAMCSMLGVHRDPKYWGPDAEHFDPDRFLPERFNLTHPCSFIPFSYGPRNCVGYQYAMISMKTTLAAILRRFRVVGDQETGPIPTMKLKFDITMRAADDYEVTLKKRISHLETS